MAFTRIREMGSALDTPERISLMGGTVGLVVTVVGAVTSTHPSTLMFVVGAVFSLAAIALPMYLGHRRVSN